MPKPIQAQESFVDMPFPFFGISKSYGFGRQQKDTTIAGFNVRGFDPATGRRRGAQRPGLQRYIDALVNSTASIQEISSVVGVFAEAPIPP